ncbi:hypothetical protein ACNQR9_22725 [Mycolicibacterium peregrinum]
MAMKPWDGDRPQTPRTVLKQDIVSARGLSFNFVSERISAPTDWCSVDATNHVMYVYRHGAMRSMETLLDWDPQDVFRPARETSGGNLPALPAQHWSKATLRDIARSQFLVVRLAMWL